MRVVFLPLAKQELAAAKRYYERQQPGLGERFKGAADSAGRRIALHPLAWAIERDPIRRCLLDGFPYKLLYAVRDHEIVVMAVAHQHRLPDYWLDRVDSA
jgi:plasmid stabilization system protein ParE